MVYIDRVARCVRGYGAWSYETNRYYGDDGLKVRGACSDSAEAEDYASGYNWVKFG